MRILTRYVLLEMCKVFGVALLGLTLMMIVVGAVREALQQSLPLGQLLRLIPYILPDALRVSVPVTLLLATTSVYGRIAGANEMVAAKSLGISPLRLLAPTFVFAFALSLVTVWLNDLAVSWGREGAQRVVVEAVEEIVYSMLRAQRSYSSPRFSINVRCVTDRRLMLPTVSVIGQNNAPTMTIRAEEAELHADHDRGVLRVILRNGTVDVDGKLSIQFPDEHEQEIPLRDATRVQEHLRPASWVPLLDIPQQEYLQRIHIRKYELELAARAGLQMVAGDFAGLTSGEWNSRCEYLETARSQIHRLKTEPHRRWSAGFSCLCFAFVGAPMAIRLKNRDFLTSFFLCFLPILVVYYPLLAYGINGAKSGAVPPVAVWAGNLLLLVCGGVLLKKVIRY
ncbi:MAG: LptF/LptG family permease [Planctomycetota bacterium]